MKELKPKLIAILVAGVFGVGFGAMSLATEQSSSSEGPAGQAAAEKDASTGAAGREGEKAQAAHPAESQQKTEPTQSPDLKALDDKPQQMHKKEGTAGAAGEPKDADAQKDKPTQEAQKADGGQQEGKTTYFGSPGEQAGGASDEGAAGRTGESQNVGGTTVTRPPQKDQPTEQQK